MTRGKETRHCLRWHLINERRKVRGQVGKRRSEKSVRTCAALRGCKGRPPVALFNPRPVADTQPLLAVAFFSTWSHCTFVLLVNRCVYTVRSSILRAVWVHALSNHSGAVSAHSGHLPMTRRCHQSSLPYRYFDEMSAGDWTIHFNSQRCCVIFKGHRPARSDVSHFPSDETFRFILTYWCTSMPLQG